MKASVFSRAVGLLVHSPVMDIGLDVDIELPNIMLIPIVTSA